MGARTRPGVGVAYEVSMKTSPSAQRRWICSADNRWMMIMGPAHRGQAHVPARAAAGWLGWGCVFGASPMSRRHRATDSDRCRFVRNPKCRMRTEPRGKKMQQETAEELIGGDRHLAFLAAVGVVFPAERDPAVLERHEPVIGDGDPVCVSCQVMQNVFGTAERALGVNDPVVPEQLPAEAAEVLCLRQVGQVSMEAQLATTERTLQASVELATEDSAEHLHRKEELRG